MNTDQQRRKIMSVASDAAELTIPGTGRDNMRDYFINFRGPAGRLVSTGRRGGAARS
jgi:hypothetical protein